MGMFSKYFTVRISLGGVQSDRIHFVLCCNGVSISIFYDPLQFSVEVFDAFLGIHGLKILLKETRRVIQHCLGIKNSYSAFSPN